ncbi:MAG: hypothetical protein KC657_26190 [Myxococcales bacterium]|nr:hypothetical protein [Myxococcales bacterium]
MSHTVLTIDVDWAPDAAIDFTADLLASRGVKATWFLTHDSPAVARLRERPELFELGIHPNFLPGSSHGATPEDVLDYCMKLVPDATSVRTHALVQSTPLYDLVLRRTPVRCDVSLLLPHARRLDLVEYQWKGTTLLRLPYHWEDDIEMLRDAPAWDLETAIAGEGYRVFDFHPIHVFLNSADMGPYESLKAAVRPLGAATIEQMQPFVHEGPGPRTVFTALADHLAAHGGGARVRDVYNAWRESR